MATPAQIAANQRNSQKSTGPTSPDGKAASSRNRLSHGFASSATVMPGEDPAEFKALLDSLIDEFQPATVAEQILVEKLAVNTWLSQRAFRLQGYAFAAQSFQNEKFGIPKDLGLLIRYHAAAERAFHKAHNELVKVQKERRKSQIGFDPQNAVKPPASSSADPEAAAKIVPTTPIQTDPSPATTAKAASASSFSVPTDEILLSPTPQRR